jgi:hypothetical protein
MNTTIVNIQNIEVNSDEIDILKNMLEKHYSPESFKINQAKSFSGMQDIILILSIGGGVAIKQLGNIIVEWINKDKNKKIKYKNIEVSGYSAKEVTEILSKVNDDE